MSSNALGTKEIAQLAVDHSIDGPRMRDFLCACLTREPEKVDLYNAGKTLFQAGVYHAASVCLELVLVLEPNSVPSWHLLGYCRSRMGQDAAAIEAFRRCVNAGFDADWQLLVELEIESAEEVGGSAAVDAGAEALREMRDSKHVYLDSDDEVDAAFA